MSVLSSFISGRLGWLLLVVFAAGISAGGTLQGWRLGAQLATAEKDHSDYVAEVERNAREASEQARKTERALRERVKELEDHAQNLIDRHAGDSAAAASSLQRLLDRAKAAEQQSRACGNSLTASLSAATDPSAGVFAQLLERLGAAAGFYAATADQRGVAGQLCVDAYKAAKSALAAEGG